MPTATTSLNRHSRPTQDASNDAEQLAELSRALVFLMRRHELTMRFGPLGSDGLCLADATQNPTNAYKARGALASAFLAQASGATTVWTASAGNHGAGLAYAAKQLGMSAIIYVPENAPDVKVQNIERFGAKVIRLGGTFDECLSAAQQERRSVLDGARFVHPFDEHAVVAGQGTIGLELIDHTRNLALSRSFESVRIFVPIGGGGLSSGIASVIKACWPEGFPRPEVIGVVDESSPASVVGAFFGRPVKALPDTIADGTRVALVGRTFIGLASLIDQVILIPHDALVGTMRDYYSQKGVMLEPSGALALAGYNFSRRHSLFPEMHKGLSYALVSGSNVDPSTFNETLSAPARMDYTRNVRCAFDVCVQERDGELVRFLRAVREFNIAGLTYKQIANTNTGTLRVDFEVARDTTALLEQMLLDQFQGTTRLRDGQQASFSIGETVAGSYQDELIILDDKPGSFLQWAEDQPALGSVGFLFYRQPAQPGSKAQVVIGTHRSGLS